MDAIKHSGLGIASCIISFISYSGFSIMFMTAILVTLKPELENECVSEIMVTLILFSFILLIPGLTLGIAGIFQKERKRIFAIIGIILPILLSIILILLMCFGE